MGAVAEHDIQQDDADRRLRRCSANSLPEEREIDHRMRPSHRELVVA